MSFPPTIEGVVYLGIVIVLLVSLAQAKPPRHRYRGQRRGTATTGPASPARARGRQKPPWVRAAVIRLKANDPDASCCHIAATFRAMYDGVETVGHTFVWKALRDEKYRVEALRRQIRRRRPGAGPRNWIWGVDLTSVPVAGRTRLALGILDHGTRACISLRALTSKHSFRAPPRDRRRDPKVRATDRRSHRQ